MLCGFWDHVRPIPTTPLAAPPAHATAYPRVETPAIRPSPEVQFILFSGKGGVGKTTLSCATALRLAHDFSEKRVLLYSTDPAHSLSVCLQAEIGPRPVALRPNLTAIEIDACAEFEALKTEYAGDVEEFLQSLSGSCDLTFDRVVLEKIMDLAPPGLDEVMALTRIIDFLVHGHYDLFVLDSASTGHFLRLMELPDLVDQWLKTFFRLLLKYERFLHLPRFSNQLIELSKNLKRFRKLLSDPARSALYAVSIPTRMAWEETKDLLAACHRMGIAVPAIFLNLMTPPGDCSLCSGLRRRELHTVGSFRQTFPSQQQILVYRQGEVGGIQQLEELAWNLYQTPTPELVATYALE